VLPAILNGTGRRALFAASYKVSVGNSFLADYARKYNRNTVIIPTVVNTDTVHGRLQDQSTSKPVIGWTGTFSTLKYLDIILPSLQRLQDKFDFVFIVIANKDPKLPLKNYRFIAWNKETESEDLLKLHIGLMPLYDDDLSRGKCGFKAIQYMALGIPAVVSPVGVNTAIVDNGLMDLYDDPGLKRNWRAAPHRMRNKMGAAQGVRSRQSILWSLPGTILLRFFHKLTYRD
jgi:glycosyltransferase involved in cell wall biosynthesis